MIETIVCKTDHTLIVCTRFRSKYSRTIQNPASLIPAAINVCLSPPPAPMVSKAPNMAPKAIMMPASPSRCPAPWVKLNPSLSAGTPATSPVTNVPIRIEKNGTIFNQLINAIMIARPKDTENNSCVSCAVQGATEDIRTAVNDIDNQRVNCGQHPTQPNRR
jgi:hypothetical protein